MPSSHPILCRPFSSCPQSLSASVFSNESILCMRWPKYWSFSFSISPSNEHPGLISFRMDWLDLLAVQGTFKSLLQRQIIDHRKSKRIPENIYFCFIDYAKAFDCVNHSKLWKILKETGIPDHFTCPLRNLYPGQDTIVRTGHGTIDWFKTGKGVCQGYILSPCLFNLYAEYILGWMNHKSESRLPREISVTSNMQMTPPKWQKVKRN